ncbi:hypothetical protein TRFO_18012 [Tritrichomonas foetus]|uniref:Protein kinase domain-containing protein n=1 Tax=Tritrichomonas foetus TaxID=1144522 RepID=A0A1J4KR73_9EUKA|nr:hypothetical protein TRFO_18012 [Tritrichomonas foetus]|eukprot:OHT12300.1 hypothetical protein TRFO_18012 [Tritrichomonas foetus]
MGSGISAKFDNVTHHFDIGVWKVHNAISKATGKRVSLWVIDYHLLKQKDRNKKTRRRYLQHCEKAIQMQMKIQHPNILKIFEAASAGKKFGFSSERVDFALSHEKKYTRDEAVYITQQLASTLKYLHDHRIAFLGHEPDNVFLNERFSLKLGLFLHAAQFQDHSNNSGNSGGNNSGSNNSNSNNNNSGSNLNVTLSHPFMNWFQDSPYFIPVNYCAPEMITQQTFTPMADVYMFALTCVFVFTGKAPTEASNASEIDTSLALVACSDLPPEYSKLLKNCLSTNESARPTFSQILEDEAFTSLVCGVFKYIDLISKKEPKDLFNFFSGLKNIIKVFSFRIIHQKFLPIFIHFIKKDVRYAIALLPMILKSHHKFNDQQFFEDIVKPLQPILTISEPHEIPGILIDHIGIFIKRIPEHDYTKYVYPIVLTALKCNSKKVLGQSLAVLPQLISIMPTENIKKDFIPTINKLLELIQDQDFAISIIRTLIITIKKTGPEFIAESSIPSIRRLWYKQQWPGITEIIADMIYLMKIPLATQLKTSVLLASDILSCSNIPTLNQSRFVNYIQNVMTQIITERNITNEEIEQAASIQPKEYELPQNELKDQGEEEEVEDDEELGEETTVNDDEDSLDDASEIDKAVLEERKHEIQKIKDKKFSYTIDLGSIVQNDSNLPSQSNKNNYSKTARFDRAHLFSEHENLNYDVEIKRFSLNEKSNHPPEKSVKVPPIAFDNLQLNHGFNVEDSNSESSRSAHNSTNSNGLISPRIYSPSALSSPRNPFHNQIETNVNPYSINSPSSIKLETQNQTSVSIRYIFGETTSNPSSPNDKNVFQRRMSGNNEDPFSLFEQKFVRSNSNSPINSENSRAKYDSAEFEFD